MRKRSKFSLSNYHNLTCQMGYMVPIHLAEVLPGDSIQQSTSVFARFAPMVAPVMHPTHMSVHHYYVPTRILWADFENFITGGPDGLNSSVPPTVNVAVGQGSLADYFGLPVNTTLSVSALPFRAYDLIYNDYYRDQDLMPEVPISFASGADTSTGLSLLRPCWRKDYFTTARPWPQKGAEVTIPVQPPSSGGPSFSATTTITGDKPSKDNAIRLQGVAHVRLSPQQPNDVAYSDANGLLTRASDGLDWSNTTNNLSMWYGTPTSGGINPIVPYYSFAEGSPVGLKADTQIQYTPGAAGIGSINLTDLREAQAIQRFQEHRALYGSRYEDLLRSMGVRPQDGRLQMPEYLGGSSQVVQFSEVLQTSADGGQGVGDLYGHGIGAMRTNRYRRFIPEHGYIISILIVRPIPVYSQGVERLWSRKTKEDYWTPELQHIGQQEVLNKEVYADGSAADENTFGYQNRYDEYRRGVNIVCGEFRTNQDYWTLARIFANRPALNADFVTCTPSDRIFQVNSANSDQIYAMVKNNVIARRLVDRNGNPY